MLPSLHAIVIPGFCKRLINGVFGKLSGAGSVWLNLDEVFDQFVEDGGDIVESV